MEEILEIVILSLLFILIVIILYLYYENNFIKITNIDIIDSKIPNAFKDFTIAHISDLHNKQFGKNQKNLINQINKIAPDIIVITGDLINSYYPNIDIAMEFINNAIKVAPIYYVPGNHEARLPDNYNSLKSQMKSIGVNILENSNSLIYRDDSKINIIGVTDPSFDALQLYGYTDAQIVSKNLENLISTSDDYSILLSHRPELFDIYCSYNLDLVFAGHAHGGQIRIPFIGGILAPNQGFFPQYTSGLYQRELTSMIVSRGLGNSAFPFRVNNRPEIVSVKISNNQ